MNRLFEIQTLSDRNYGFKPSRLADPVTVITGIATIIPSLFPNLFGSERTSRAVFDKLFPGNGYWTVMYKNFLLERIKYVKDIERDLLMYTNEFSKINVRGICGSEPEVSEGGKCNRTLTLYEILKREQSTGGQSPIGNVYGGGVNYETLFLIGGGVLLLSLLLKKKSRKK